jgi:transposase-like protein
VKKSVKSVKIKEIQRQQCKACGCNYTVKLKSTAKPQSLKKQALHLYLVGLGFGPTGKFLDVSNVSVLNWIKSFGREVETLASESKEIAMVEADEKYTCISPKKLLLNMDCC